MKKLQIISKIALIISIIGFMICRFAVPISDWFVRVVGILMLVSVITTMFSSVKVTVSKK